MAILILFIEGVLFLQVPKLVAMFRALRIELTSLPGHFIQGHTLLCQGIALSVALIAVWAWVKKRGRILGVLFCCALLQMGAVAWASIHHPFSTFSSSIHR